MLVLSYFTLPGWKKSKKKSVLVAGAAAIIELTTTHPFLLRQRVRRQ
jgi:hypothetical protein